MTQKSKPKVRFAVMVEPPEIDSSYGSSGNFWELSIVRIDAEKESPRNCDRDSWERPEERIFEDLAIRCYISWYGGKFEARSFSVEYRRVFSVDMNCAKILFSGLQRVHKIIESFPIKPESFGQFVCLLAGGLGVKEMVRKSPHSDRRHGIMYSDYQWQVLPLSSAQRIVDELIDAAKERMFPTATTESQAEVA